MTAMADSIPMGHRYTDWYAESLRSDLATLHSVGSNQIIAGCGATEILRLCALAFADPAGNVVSPYPSYSQFPSDAGFLGASVRYADLDASYAVDLSAMAAQVDANTTVLILTNPNNPTGPVLGASEISAFIDALPAHVAVIIDEAYHEYIQDAGYASAMEDVRQGRKVVVIRTFSKVFGLAGVRIGYAVGHQDLISAVRSWQIYGTVSRPAMDAARAALGDSQHITDTVTLCNQAKQYCFDELDLMGLDYIPSETNFFMVDVDNGAWVRSELANAGILVRQGWGMPQHIRVSAGTMQEMEDFITELQNILAAMARGEPGLPRITSLDGNQPNPFRGATSIGFGLAHSGRVRLEVFSIEGRRLRTLIDGPVEAGRHTLRWDGRDTQGRPVGAGSYFYRLIAGDVRETRRMIRL